MRRESQNSVLYIVGISLAAIFAQTFFVPIIEVGVWRPDIVLLAILYIGYRYGTVPGVLIGFVLGIAQDTMSPLPLGISSFANTMIGFTAGQIRQFKLASNAILLAGVLLILFHGCIFYFFYHLQAEVTYIYLLLTRVFPNTIYTFTIGLLISFFMRSNLKRN
jgi:rod shape-determining protein MreD